MKNRFQAFAFHKCNLYRYNAVFLISEMNPAKMALLAGLDAFVQVACPRWGCASSIQFTHSARKRLVSTLAPIT